LNEKGYSKEKGSAEPLDLSTNGFRLCLVCALETSEVRTANNADKLRGVHRTDYGATGIQLPPTVSSRAYPAPAELCEGRGGSGMRGEPKLRKFSSTRSMRWRPGEGWMHCSATGAQGQCHTHVTTSMLSINATPMQDEVTDDSTSKMYAATEGQKVYS
jgi:hypothetical protein